MVARFGAREGDSGGEFAACESRGAEDFYRREYLGAEEERSGVGRTRAGFDAATFLEIVRQGVCGDRGGESRRYDRLSARAARFSGRRPSAGIDSGVKGIRPFHAPA